MPTPIDKVFAAVVLEAELASEQQLETARATLASIGDLGGRGSLAEVLVRQKVLTEEQAVEFSRRSQREVIDGYELIGRLGKGGMGAVYLAKQISLDRHVAVKILPRSAAKDPEFFERFLREAKAAAELNHPNIVQGYDAGQSSGYFYFAMEYVAGPSAEALVEKEGSLSEVRALEIARQVAEGLAHAHRSGIIHRDVKPENILITKDGVAKLADLGLVRRTKDKAHLTRDGSAVGTPLYMSPEQARGESGVDGRSDVYSLGATLFFLLSAQEPFTGETSAVIMTKHLSETAPSVHIFNPAVSEPTARLITWMLAKLPAERPQTMERVIETIRGIIAGREVEIAIPSAERRRPRRRGRRWGDIWWPRIAITSTAVVIALLVGHCLSRRAEKTPADPAASAARKGRPTPGERKKKRADSKRERAERRREKGPTPRPSPVRPPGRGR